MGASLLISGNIEYTSYAENPKNNPDTQGIISLYDKPQ